VPEQAGHGEEGDRAYGLGAHVQTAAATLRWYQFSLISVRNQEMHIDQEVQ
jgi:hypothetical protein